LGWLIYDTLVNWMSNPLGPEGRAWVDLTHRAAIALIESLVQQRDYDELSILIAELHEVNPGVDIGRIVPRILQIVLPITPEDAHLSQNVFLLAVKHLDHKAFVSLMNATKFRQMLD